MKAVLLRLTTFAGAVLLTALAIYAALDLSGSPLRRSPVAPSASAGSGERFATAGFSPR